MAAFTVYAFSDFGFGDSTGAPLKKKAYTTYTSCATTGCHLGNKINDERGTAGIISNIPATGWEAGKTYRITAKINYPSRDVFGFQLMVWGDKDSVSIGTLSKESADPCMIFPNTLYNASGDSVGINTYATHSQKCIVSTENGQPKGQNQWSFNWTAPSARNQNAIIYGVFVAANGNGSQSGDFVYRISRNADTSATPLVSSIEDWEIGKKSFSIFPNPADDFISINTKIANNGPCKASIYNIQGSKIINRDWNISTTDKTIDIRLLPPGAYTLLLKMDNKLESTSFIKR